MDATERDLIELVAKLELGIAEPADLVAWATRALVDGWDTPSLRELATADVEGAFLLREIVLLFQRVQTELDGVPPSGDVAVRHYVRYLAEEIVEGRAEPREQVERICTEVLGPLAYPRDLMIWRYLSDGLVPRVLAAHLADAVFDDTGGAELDDAIRQVARWYLLENVLE